MHVASTKGRFGLLADMDIRGPEGESMEESETLKDEKRRTTVSTDVTTGIISRRCRRAFRRRVQRADIDVEYEGDTEEEGTVHDDGSGFINE